MRAAVLALGERMPASSAARRPKRKQDVHGDDGGAAPIREETAEPAGNAADEPRAANRPRRASARSGRRAKG
jgi:hypothetical protein